MDKHSNKMLVQQKKFGNQSCMSSPTQTITYVGKMGGEKSEALKRVMQ